MAGAAGAVFAGAVGAGAVSWHGGRMSWVPWGSWEVDASWKLIYHVVEGSVLLMIWAVLCVGSVWVLVWVKVWVMVLILLWVMVYFVTFFGGGEGII